jgi:hypothetical protein
VKLKRGVWLLLSALLHVAVVLLMLQAVFAPRTFLDWFRMSDPDRVEERLVYVQVAPRTEPPVAVEPVAPPSRPASTTSVPSVSEVPAAPPAAVASSIPPTALADTGSGPPVGSGVGGAPRLVGSPSYADERIFSTKPFVPLPERTGIARLEYNLDSALAVLRKQDSLAVGRRSPTDWTIGEGNTKVGLDEKWIYIGPVKLPTFLLGLVPLNNLQANPNSRENNRTLGAMAAEARALGPLNKARGDENAAINARMERLRAMRRAAAGGGDGSSQGPQTQSSQTGGRSGGGGSLRNP